jgi:hypothetical protein
MQAQTGTTEDLAGTPPPPRAAASTSGSSPAQAPQARAPNKTSQHRWGGVYPKPTLLLSVRGCEWGSNFEAPEQRYHITPQQGRKRTQVYESSKMVHNHAEAVAMKKSIKSNTAKLEKAKCILTRSKDSATINSFIDNMPCRDTPISQDSSLPTRRI